MSDVKVLLPEVESNKENALSQVLYYKFAGFTSVFPLCESLDLSSLHVRSKHTLYFTYIYLQYIK